MKFREQKMIPVRTACVPWFSSQPSPGQRLDPHPDQTVQGPAEPLPQGQRDKRGSKRDKESGGKPTLKVKLPKLDKKVTKKDKTQRRWPPGPAADSSKTATSRENSAGTVPDSVARDVFYFSQRSTNETISEKEKAKLAVLRTISRVLEENQLIRQRLVTLSQAN